MNLALDRGFRGFPYWLYKRGLRGLIRQIEPYHPVSLGEQVLSKGERGCSDRWEVIDKILASGQDSVLDLGCAEGYFVQRTAREYQCVVLGVDADVRRLTIGQDVNLLNKNERAGFMYAHITPEFLAKLPVFDTVIFLSVLHHVMYEHGVERAREYMEIIRSKTAKTLIFDMGQSDETSMDWARLLPDMGSDPHQWIEEFLRSCGFSKVVKAGETDAYQSAIRRAIFVVSP